MSSRVCKSGFIQKPAREQTGVAECMILPADLLRRRETRAELCIAGQIRLVAPVIMVAIRNAIPVRQPLVDATDAIPEVGWTRDRDRDASDFDWCSIDWDVLSAVVVFYGRVDIAEKVECGKCRLTRHRCFARTQRDC